MLIEDTVTTEPNMQATHKIVKNPPTGGKQTFTERDLRFVIRTQYMYREANPSGQSGT